MMGWMNPFSFFLYSIMIYFFYLISLLLVYYSVLTFLLINLVSLCFDSWNFCHSLATLFPTFLLLFVIFCMLWMLLTVHKPYHVPHATRITTLGTIFTEIIFSVSKERVRSWLKSLWQSVEKKIWGGKNERKKARMAITKLFEYY